MKIKDYTWDEVRIFDNGAESIQQQMDELRSKGWKKLRLRGPSNSWGDVSGTSVSGYRPMTKAEISECNKRIEEMDKEDIKMLRKLAKEYGYKLVKV